MGRNNFIDLLRALQLSLVNAQKALKNRQLQSCQNRCEKDAAGRLRAKTLVFAVPCNGISEESLEMFSLPLVSLQDPRCPQISMLSLEFECELKEKKGFKNDKEPKMFLKVRGKSSAPGKKGHRLHIYFYGTDQPCGEVLLDGELLMPIPPLEEWGDIEPVSQAKRSMLRALGDWWERRCGAQEFVMAAEQAARIRELLFSQ